ncbi:MAG: hypothetical protein ABIP93_09490, partial [Gemmatimonadaceae bacterium]
MRTELDRPDRTTDDAQRGQSRRAFLRAAGLGGAVLAFPSLFAACSADASTAPLAPGAADAALLHGNAHSSAGVVLDFSTDIGVLNYAYALEQLEAAFYMTVVYHPYHNMPHQEL